MIYTYISSNGKTFPMYEANVRVTAGNFRSHSWTPVTFDLFNGSKVSRFRKEPVTYKLTFTLRGDLDERKAYIDALISAKEHDIRYLQPGRVYAGDFYAECYFISSDAHISKALFERTDIDLEMFVPSGFWRKEQEFAPFMPVEDDVDNGWLDYPYGYNYGYAKGKNLYVVNNDSDFESEFKITVYGPAENPRIYVNGHTYRVNISLLPNERIEIDSSDKTIYKFGNGIVENAIGKRYKASSVFEKIGPGEITVSWDGSFGFNLTLYDDRVEPPWRQ